MPVYFEPRKRKNRSFNLPHLVMIGTLVLAAGLLLAGIALLTPVVLAPVEPHIEPAPAAPEPFAPEVYGVLIEKDGTDGIAQPEALAAQMNQMPNSGTKAIQLLHQTINSKEDAQAALQKYHARMVIWKISGKHLGTALMVTLDSSDLRRDAPDSFKQVWLPYTFSLLSPYSDALAEPVSFANGVIVYQQGDYERAKHLFEIAQAWVDTGVLSLWEGNARFRLGDYDGAVVSYSQVVDSGYALTGDFARMNRGNAYYLKDDKLAALEDFTAVQSDNERLSAEATYNRAVVAEELHLYIEALNQYALLIDGRQGYRDARVRWRRLDDKLQGERKVCQEMVDTDTSGFNVEARYYKCLKDFDTALEWAERGLAEAPNCRHYRWLGYIQRLHGDVAASRQSYDRALALCPNDYTAQVGAGTTAGLLGDAAAAQAYYASTQASDPYSPGFTLWGSMYEEQGNLRSAGENYWNWMRRPDAVAVGLDGLQGNQVMLELRPGKYYLLPVTGRAGQKLSAAAAAENPYIQDTLLVLLDSAGNPLAGAGDRHIEAGDWNAHLAGFPLPADGEYRIALTQYGSRAGMQVTVTYSLR